MTHRQKAQITALTSILLLLAITFHRLGYPALNQSILILSTLIAGLPITIKALQSLRMKAFSIELLVMIAVIGALIIREYVESAAVTFLFLFGAYLEARTLEKTRSSLKALIELAPLEATLIRNGESVIVSVEELEEGDHVIIRSGEKVAVDGRIVSGHAFLNEAAMTGESVLASKKTDDRVLSGTIVDNGFIEVIAEKVGDETTFAKMIELIEEAQESKTKTQKFLEKFANIYTPAIVGLSIIVYIFSRNIELALTFLVIACPGALVISAPVSIVAGIGNGARNGILIKGGEVMEKLAKIDVVVFDKTGTLTKGKPEVTEIKSYMGQGTEDELLQIAAEAEIVSEHHLGQTIVKEARKRNIPFVHEPQDVNIVKGHGIRAMIDGQTVVIGNRKMMSQEGIPLTKEIESDLVEREKAGNTAIIVSLNSSIAGMISIADQIRPEAAHAIRQLRESGIKKVYMLTGDNAHAANLVGTTLELDEVHAELLPEQKVAIIKELQAAAYQVAMVGDGINDAPAIATADIGLAMGEGGTDVSMETADIVLMADRLDQFAHAYSLSKATVRNMKQNTYFAVGTVALLLIGVLWGKIFLASGMLVHELSVLLVILNAIRLIRYHNHSTLTTVGHHANERMLGHDTV